ncbi:hypothetical protein ACFWYW_35590 [Nonomuraea sp. NPDC059023]|uniref:hypothetical protein n=1 Tax=unclassified Nonomuraea TaxID=2593643 RepID=UPI003696B897
MDSGILVTDRAEGRTLAQAVSEGGALSPNATHRLALAVLTALASVHRTGEHHGDLGPHTVVLGADGTHVLRGTPAGDGGQSADMFAWAALVAYAATGRDPFGEVDKRRRYGAADLGALHGELRELVADCLAEDPEHRPAAEEALLRLLGQSGALETALPDTPEPPRRRPRALLLISAAVVIVLVFGALGYVLTPRTVSAQPVAAGTPSRPASATLTTPAAPKQAPATRTITLPGGAGTLWENAADQVRLTSYYSYYDGGNSEDSVAYARTPDGSAFARTGGANISSPISPDNRWTATVNELHLLTTERLDVGFTHRVTGEKFTVPTVSNPRWGVSPQWSRDSRTLLLSLMERDEQVESAFVRGFILIDVERRRATVVETANAEDVAQFRKQAPEERTAHFYRWAAGDQLVASGYLTPENAEGIRYRDLSGKVVRSMHWVGRPVGQTPFSPSGKRLVTTVCSKKQGVCVWDADTGTRLADVPPGAGYMYGWYDEDHLIVGRVAGKKMIVEAVDFKGEVTRKLVELVYVKGKLPQLRFDRY